MGKKTVLFVSALLAAIPAIAQMPDGSDINQAIPIYFGQVVNDIIDGTSKPIQVYSIPLARGQKVTVTADIKASPSNPNWAICLYSPDTRTVPKTGCQGQLAVQGFSSASGLAFDSQVATSGTYYVTVLTRAVGDTFRLVVSAQGTPLVTALPPPSGCLTGQVDYLTYSLQLIAVDLPDEISIGGVVACPTCTVKAPLYPEIVRKMESALKAQVPVSACYDASGNIVQLKVMHQ